MANSSRGQKSYHIVRGREVSGLFASGVQSKNISGAPPKSSQNAESARMSEMHVPIRAPRTTGSDPRRLPVATPFAVGRYKKRFPETHRCSSSLQTTRVRHLSADRRDHRLLSLEQAQAVVASVENSIRPKYSARRNQVGSMPVRMTGHRGALRKQRQRRETGPDGPFLISVISRR